VKRGKNDAIDAEAICEAASRPSMRFVPVKSLDTALCALVPIRLCSRTDATSPPGSD